MLRAILLTAVAVQLLGCGSTRSKPEAPPIRAADLLERLPGRYSNYFSLPAAGRGADDYPWLEYEFERLDFGDRFAYIAQRRHYPDSERDSSLAVIYELRRDITVEELQLRAYQPRSGIDAGGLPDSLQAFNQTYVAAQGCGLRWRQRDDDLIAISEQATPCLLERGSQTLEIQQSMRLSGDELWSEYLVRNPQLAGQPIVQRQELALRRVHQYRGQLRYQPAGKPARTMSLSLHDGGEQQLLDTDDGKPPLRIELARDRIGNSHNERLTLKVFESEQLLASAWADADSERIGMLLSWLQISLRRSDEASHSVAAP